MTSLPVAFLLALFALLSGLAHPFSPPAFQKADPPTTTTRTFISSRNAVNSTPDSVTRREKGVIETLLASFLISTAVVALPWSLEFTLSPLAFNVGQQQPPAPQIISVQKSQAWALSEEQMLVDEVWKEVTRQFFDQTFAGQGEEGWRKKRLEAVKKATNLTPDDRPEVYAIIRTMLESLKDPYTRYLTPDQFESLTSYATGKETNGIGVQLLGDPATGNIVVVNTVTDGPAEKAGVQPGDIVLEIDGMELKGATAEVAAAKCRGAAGTFVTLGLRHDGGKLQNVDVTRAVIPNNPVQVSTFQAKNGKQIGLIKLSSFSQQTVKQVADAISQVRSKSSALVLDLRGNAGGYMPAGVDTAKLFLPPNSRIISEVDKSGRATIFTNEGVGSETELPLYILVDKRTASASEIMAAALQDNQRAIIVGSSETFGKGRIQNVQELSDGGIAVTKAKYMTPEGRDIQGVGISPDKKSSSCEPVDSAAACLNDIL